MTDPFAELARTVGEKWASTDDAFLTPYTLALVAKCDKRALAIFTALGCVAQAYNRYRELQYDMVMESILSQNPIDVYH